MSTQPTLGIIGVGELAAAIVDGLALDPEREAPTIVLSPRGAATARALAERHPAVIEIADDNAEVASRAGTLLLAVRPDDLAAALRDVDVPAATLVISAVAGVDHGRLREQLGADPTIVRAIPMPAVRQRAGVTPIHPPDPAAAALFDRLGGTLAVTEQPAFDALAAITGTVSATLAVLAAIADWAGRQPGLDPSAADAFLRGIVTGVAGELHTDEPLAAVAGGHETRGGLNEQLRTDWFDDANRAALDAALDRLLRRIRG